MSDEVARELVGRVWAELGRDLGELERLDRLPEAPLPARLDVSSLAVGSVTAASLAGASGDGDRARRTRLRLDGDRIAVAFTSDRDLLVDGRAPDVWSPLSGFWRTADGWVRTHGNYPHHAAVLQRVLGIADGAARDRIAEAMLARSAGELAAEVVAAGGLCVVVRAEDPAADAAWRSHPIVDVGSGGDDLAVRAGRREASRGRDGPLDGVRVLDLTRVIAGPVATRTLALLGADVLRVDSPRLPEFEWQHLDTGAGKRSSLLDLDTRTDRARFDALVGDADVVVTGYRPAAMARLGLDAHALRARHPHLLVASLSAWGDRAEAGEERGFDSLVQAASGIAVIEGDDGAPGTLPAQALDHATGYLLAAAVTSQLVGGGRRTGRVALSLRRTAAELLALPRTNVRTPGRELSDAERAPHRRSFDLAGGTVRTTAPAVAGVGGPLEWTAPPHPLGIDPPQWW
ncbi:carnitine dehydratase [Agromyces intestinalis]|uniref:Carnitine dehydratase n=1 Tax=Agromyces intestinalis TaxID=2592652 RepID=A0A5C1YCC1_9MICO|nr:CoA transferase [Agromyces intestinalis]QEO13258.1 carnitine dehydratase [Agromyces intestinalis]